MPFVDPPTETKPNFEEDLQYAMALVRRKIDDAEEAAFVIEQLHRTLLNINLAKYDVGSIRPYAEKHIGFLFGLRLTLHDMIPQWHQQGFINTRTEMALRDAFRSSRYLTDMLGELVTEQSDGEDGDLPAKKVFSGSTIDTLVNPDFVEDHKLNFRSGDVMLMRGGLHNSAAIARIGDNDSQFSHVGMIHVDEANKPWVVEALIEDGAVIMPLEELLEQKSVRVMLFRPKDKALGERAASIIHHHVAQSLKRNRPILYDFTMRMDTYDELYCSKLVRLAYDRASDGAYLLPTFPTGLNMKNRTFVDRIGVQTNRIFAPGDIELEPHFDLVAEWRDYRRTARSRAQDMLMDKLFEWMDERGYNFRETTGIRLISLFGHASRLLPRDIKNLIKSVVPKVPINMTRKTVAAIAMLHATSEELLEPLLAINRAHLREHGHGLHPFRISRELETLRRQRGRRIGYLVQKGKVG